MKRRRRARRKRRQKAVAAMPWWVARDSWSHEDRDEVDDSRWCQYRGLAASQRSILQRVLGARNRDPIAAGDGGKGDREAASQEGSRRFTRSDDETKHVLVPS